jgi:hypothetical protein
MKLRWILITLGTMAATAVATPSHAQTTHNSVTLSWTTPGDDGLQGTAQQFDLRYSLTPITNSNFDAATRWSSTPTPTAAGTRQTVTVTGLQGTTTYYFAIKTADEVPNWAPISNVISVATTAAPDETRPAPLAISVSSVTDTTATLSWSAVGDDSLTGNATSYDFRYSTSPITAANWASATQATGEPTPGTPGSSQSLTVRSLTRQQTYYFCARTTDNSGNISALSNVPTVTTPDTMAPASIRDLAIGWLFFGWHGLAAVRETQARVR